MYCAVLCCAVLRCAVLCPAAGFERMAELHVPWCLLQVLRGWREISGGPMEASQCFTLAELQAVFSPALGEVLVAEDKDYELKEGQFHHGMGAVLRFAWRKRNTA
jgi:hypothetical protein